MKKTFAISSIVAAALFSFLTAAPVRAAKPVIAGPEAKFQRLTAEVAGHDSERIKATAPDGGRDDPAGLAQRTFPGLVRGRFFFLPFTACVRRGGIVDSAARGFFFPGEGHVSSRPQSGVFE